MSEYDHGTGDAVVHARGHTFRVWVHPRENDLMLQRPLGASMGQGLLEGLTFNAANLNMPKPVWVAAAEELTRPVGCTVTDAYTLDNEVTWEATFTCPAGVDLRALIFAQRASLRAGQPIHP
jgi:hypothetical protein